jgi:hypothetical protein
MSIWNMTNRTKTYLAGDWTGDKDAIQIIKKWNESDNYGLTFRDVHELTNSSDDSLNCSIKRSLRQRMSISKTFVLIVGDKTTSLRSGACSTCGAYNNSYWGTSCRRGNLIDNSSYVQYECELAKEAGIKIIVLYNSTEVDKSKCPESLRYTGVHLPMIIHGRDSYGYPNFFWNYQEIKQAIMR